MTDHVNGGPAFPRAGLEGYHGPQQGMSLRDWYAGQALVGVLSALGPLKSDPKVSQEAMTKMVAEASVRIADAMIEALKGGAR